MFLGKCFLDNEIVSPGKETRTKGTLFLSTPNKDTRPKDGALSSKQWLELLADAGFVRVTAIEWQWTTVFICQ